MWKKKESFGQGVVDRYIGVHVHVFSPWWTGAKVWGWICGKEGVYIGVFGRLLRWGPR